MCFLFLLAHFIPAIINNEEVFSLYYNYLTSGKPEFESYEFPRYIINWLEYLQSEKGLAKSTCVNYANAIQTFLRWFRYLEQKSSGVKFEDVKIADITLEEINGLTRTDLSSFLSFCMNDLENKESARQNKLSALRSLYSYLQNVDESRKITHNPAVEVTSPKRKKPLPKYLTLDESKLLLDTIKQEKSLQSSRDYCMILWFITCGMRLTELAGINLQDIRRSSNETNLLLRGKGSKERLVVLNELCLEALDYYMVYRASMNPSPSENALFLSNQGTRISQRQIERTVAKYIKQAGLGGRSLSPHKLRHTSATLMYQSGSADILEIKEILGHSSVSTTQIYCHTSGNMVKSALESMGDLLGSPAEGEKQQ